MKTNQSLSSETTLYIFRNSSYFPEVIYLIIRYSKTNQKTFKQNNLSSITNLRCKFSEIHFTFQIINLIIRYSKADQKTSKQNHLIILNLCWIYSEIQASYFQDQSEDKKPTNYTIAKGIAFIIY